ncbi:MAG: signal peptidase II [Cocleimonas sp.]
MLKYLWITFVVVFIDQITKWMAEANLELGKDIYEVFSHLNFALAYNYGAAFSFLGDQGGWQRWFFVIIATVVSIVILIWLARLKENEKGLAIGLALILGGAVGNLIDRFLHGRVIDFIDVHADWDVFFLQNGHFATFNVADIAINIGAVLLVGISLFAKDDEE